MWEKLNSSLEQLDIQEWLEEYAEIKSAGEVEFRIKDCPVCGNEKFKLYVNPNKPAWNCKVCDWGRGLGDVITLLATVSGRSPTSVRLELLSIVTPTASGDISSMLQRAFDKEEDETEDYGFEEIATPGQSAMIVSSITGMEVCTYAFERGLLSEDLITLDLRAAQSLLSPKGTPMNGPFLVFPIKLGKKTVSWQGRRIRGDKEPKYISAPNIKDWLYPLNERFFAKYKGQIFLVEGIFDALGMIRLGIPAVCTFGTSISNKQLELLKELKPEKVCFAWDLDAYNNVSKTVERIAHHFPNTYVAMNDGSLEGKKLDAGEALRDYDAAKWVLTNTTEENMLDVRSVEFFRWRISKL